MAPMLPVLAAIAYDPILRIPLGPLEVSPHGIMIAVGVLVGARFALPGAARRGIDAEHLYDVLTWALVGALLGARVAYVINHLGDYTGDLLGILRVWEGGFSLLGGLAGAVVAGYPKLRSLGIPFWRFMDAAVPGLALGIAVGRIGDLVIADHLGKRTDFFLGYVCPDVDTGSPCVAPVGEAVHQTALYDMVGAAAVFVLLVLLSRRRRPESLLTLVFGLGYGAVRLGEGFFRLDVTHGTGLNGSQWTALVVMVAAAVGLVALRGREPEPAPEPAPDPAPEGASEPEPERAPEPAPEGASEPEPEPAPEPAPEGASEPEPEPAPEPAQGASEPEPEPAPEPAPAPASEPGPAPGSQPPPEPQRGSDAGGGDDERSTPAPVPDEGGAERPGDPGA